MSDARHSNRYWMRRVRALRDRSMRESEGVCFVEGIRQVLAAYETGHPFEALLIDPRQLRSNVAWRAVTALRDRGVPVIELTKPEFERISVRDNPAGIAALVAWQPASLDSLKPTATELYLVTDRVSDAGNLGTLMRTADSLGVSGVIVHGGVDPAHPAALRASLGSAFHLGIVAVTSLDDVFHWAAQYDVSLVATSARAQQHVWDANLTGRIGLLMGNEGQGLDAETVERCQQTVMIPMTGSATSLNVGIAAGIILYEATRQSSG